MADITFTDAALDDLVRNLGHQADDMSDLLGSQSSSLSPEA